MKSILLRIYGLVCLSFLFSALSFSSIANAEGAIFARSENGQAVKVGYVIDDRYGSVFDVNNSFKGFSVEDGGLFDANSNLVGFLNGGETVTRRGENLGFVTAGGQLVDLLNNSRLLGWVDANGGAPSQKDKRGLALLFLLGNL